MLEVTSEVSDVTDDPDFDLAQRIKQILDLENENCLSKVNCLTMVVTFDLVSPVFRLFSSQKLQQKLQRDDKSMPKSSCARACQTLCTQVPASGTRRMQMLNYACPPHASYACPPSANLVCDVTGLSVFYVVSACPILRGRAARFSRASIEIQ